MRDIFREPATNQQEANEQLLEMIRLDNRKGILLWLQTPRSSLLLSKCEAANVTPLQVSNPEMLLPRAARVCRRLSRWLNRAAHRVAGETSQCWLRFYVARGLQDMAVKDNQPMFLRALATKPAQQSCAARLDSPLNPLTPPLPLPAEGNHRPRSVR